MKIAVAQINPIIGDFDHNAGRIKHFAGQAASDGCDLIVFSELAVSGYPPLDFLEKADFVEANFACLDNLLTSIRGIGVICGCIERNPVGKGKPLFNSAVLFEDGKILHKVRKRLLPTYDVFDESRYFEPGLESASYPYKGHNIGLTVCEDGWNDPDIFKKSIYPIDPVALVVEDGADMVINISASPFRVGNRAFRWHMFGTMAEKYGVPFIFANQVGGNDSVLYDGISAVFDINGNIVARARDFEEDFVIFDTTAREGSEFMSDQRHAVSGSDIESILNALVMGTRDYVTKCGFSTAVVGLSGGIDSALTACVAAKALGRENVSAVFMPSRYTSDDNFQDTHQLSENIGIEIETIPIDGIFDEFLKYLSPVFDKTSPGITEQNIQARIRGSILMGLSNKHGSLVLSTGNKSELAVGYCTLYGDMNGGLAVISDVPKTMVYELARFINAEKTMIPQRIVEKAPSAELKPDQADEDDLPPYDILDPILKGYIEDFKGLEDLVEMGFERHLVKDVISRIHRNEYKRYQAAPGLKVTSKAFGYGRRYPLAQQYTPI
ncbi:MAG: NAD+ synthase [Deltaproteobacteria bacterium]|nr:NAD+ synthase [Deltaproteobacteria bacterium]MBW2193591.1 NAD+ synthase [Deltaproteobacteria bacterium]